MKPRIHIYLSVLLLAFLSAESQKITKTDRLLLANLQHHFEALSADTAGGRAMGSPGEKAAGDYVISELSQAGARPKGDHNGWLQTFTIDEGRQIGADALFTIDEHPLTVGREWFPLALSPAAEVTGSPAIALQESGVPWFQDLREWLEAGADNPRFDLAGEIRAKAISCAKKGATALILYNSSTRYPDKLTFNPRDKPEPVTIPVIYITREAKHKYLKDESASVDLRIRISFAGQHRTGNNIIAFLDNGAPTTVAIGTRYDNSSGLAAMIELARLLAASKLKNNNYLFLVFSGSDHQWPGSEYYAAHPVIDLKKMNYLIELDRLNTPADTLNIGGFNSSSAWAVVGNSVRERSTRNNSTRERNALSLHYDSSADQPGDHSAFYRQQIPVLVFSTGHGSADGPHDPGNYPGELRAFKFIYALIEGANSQGRLAFTK
ncbi:MAG TPA: M28 family peptidase [Puia sp.]|nr:M28 family peptidase [Puia sp.]